MIKIKLIIGMVITFVVLSGVVIFKSDGMTDVNKSEITIDRKNGDRVYKNNPFTGIAVSYHDNGKVSKKEQFLEGRRHGYVKHWFPSGLLGFVSSYQKGRREGETSSWWNNGNLRSKTFYLNDKTEGESWRWYSSGDKYKKLNYSAGKPVGLQQGWRTNGKLFSNFEYKNGRVYGLRKSNLCVDLKDEKVVYNKIE